MKLWLKMLLHTQLGGHDSCIPRVALEYSGTTTICMLEYILGRTPVHTWIVHGRRRRVLGAGKVHSRTPGGDP